MPYESLILGLKFEVRVGDLTARDCLVVTCEKCHHRYNVAPHVLLSRYNEMRKITEIAKHDMKCKRCSNVGQMSWHVMRARGPEFPRSA
jgi:hypothetical protein